MHFEMRGLSSVEPSEVKKKQPQMAEQLQSEGLAGQGWQIPAGTSERKPSPSPLCNNPAALANTKCKHSQTLNRNQNSAVPCQSKRLKFYFSILGFKEVTQPVGNEDDVTGAPAFA